MEKELVFQGILSKAESSWCSEIGQFQKQTVALSKDRERRAAPSSTALLSLCCFCLGLPELHMEAAQFTAGFCCVGCPARSELVRSWDDYTFLLGGQLESNAGPGLELLKISR